MLGRSSLKAAVLELIVAVFTMHYIPICLLARSSFKAAVLELIVAVFTMHYIPICLEGLVSKQQSLS